MPVSLIPIHKYHFPFNVPKQTKSLIRKVDWTKYVPLNIKPRENSPADFAMYVMCKIGHYDLAILAIE